MKINPRAHRSKAEVPGATPSGHVVARNPAKAVAPLVPWAFWPCGEDEVDARSRELCTMEEFRGMVAASGRIELQTVEDPGSFLLTHELIPTRFATVAEEETKDGAQPTRILDSHGPH